MSQIAKLHAKTETFLPVTFFVPTILAVNTFLLFGLDFQQAIPRWVKLAATIFLSF